MIACNSSHIILSLRSSLHKQDFNVKYSCWSGNDSPTQLRLSWFLYLFLSSLSSSGKGNKSQQENT